jgi:hypothetical protein
LPFLLWFPNSVRSRVFRARRNILAMIDFLKGQVTEHNAVKDTRDDTPDYLYAYQKERESGSKTGLQDTFDGDFLNKKRLQIFFDILYPAIQQHSATIFFSNRCCFICRTTTSGIPR